jgi:hypothetical protein
MNRDNQATDEEMKLMAQYGITCEKMSVYIYQEYKYDNVKDAIRYAKENSDDTRTTVAAST